MKKINILIFITFLGFCSSPNEEGIVSISDNTIPAPTISEEDYPKVLTDCLNNLCSSSRYSSLFKGSFGSAK